VLGQYEIMRDRLANNRAGTTAACAMELRKSHIKTAVTVALVFVISGLFSIKY
jgi:hypothetical protein